MYRSDRLNVFVLTVLRHFNSTVCSMEKQRGRGPEDQIWEKSVMLFSRNVVLFNIVLFNIVLFTCIHALWHERAIGDCRLAKIKTVLSMK